MVWSINWERCGPVGSMALLWHVAEPNHANCGHNHCWEMSRFVWHCVLVHLCQFTTWGAFSGVINTSLFFFFPTDTVWLLMRPGEPWNDEINSNLKQCVMGGILNVSPICKMTLNCSRCCKYNGCLGRTPSRITMMHLHNSKRLIYRKQLKSSRNYWDHYFWDMLQKPCLRTNGLQDLFQ